MKRKIFASIIALAVIGAGFFWFFSRPQTLVLAVDGLTADIENGKLLYNAGGCISCHKPPKDVSDQTLPSGGFGLHTPVGTFYPPNITADDKTGIGRWTRADFVNAMRRGVSPDGRHYFPAFPYTSYTKMGNQDLVDLFAYLKTLKVVDTTGRAQTRLFAEPLLRRAMGIWKKLALDDTPFSPDPSKSAAYNRGAYLVAGPGHCNECHTPRTFYMGLDFSRHLAGGPHPEGKGKVPSLRDLKARKRFKNIDDLNSALRFGETFGYEDISSGGMGAVQSNMAKLPDVDTRAIATYLMSLQ